MSRLCSFIILLCSGAFALAQPDPASEKHLNIFWKSKHNKARVIAAEIASGDTVADIGTANGWFLAAVAAHTDSIVFFLEDVDSTTWNEARFRSALKHFARQQARPLTNQFHYHHGDAHATGLPMGVFDKVLVIDTYHHFHYRDEMLADIVSILKPGGRLILLEAVARKPGDIHHGCRQPIFREEDIVSAIQAKGMRLEKIEFIHKVAGRKNMLFRFARAR